jgi:hypothetical protein
VGNDFNIRKLVPLFTEDIYNVTMYPQYNNNMIEKERRKEGRKESLQREGLQISPVQRL